MSHLYLTDVFAEQSSPLKIITALREKGSSPQLIWIADESTTVCLLCNTPFSTLHRRRHHCRFCLKVVCATCSSTPSSLRLCTICLSLTFSFTLTRPNISFCSSPPRCLLDSSFAEYNSVFTSKPSNVPIQAVLFLQELLDRFSISDFKSDFYSLSPRIVSSVKSCLANFNNDITSYYSFHYKYSHQEKVVLHYGILLDGNVVTISRNLFNLLNQKFLIFLINDDVLLESTIDVCESWAKSIVDILSKLFSAFSFPVLLVIKGKVSSLLLNLLNNNEIYCAFNLDQELFDSISKTLNLPIIPSIYILTSLQINPRLSQSILSAFTSPVHVNIFNSFLAFVSPSPHFSFIITSPFLPCSLFPSLKQSLRLVASFLHLPHVPFSSSLFTSSSLFYLPSQSISPSSFVDSSLLPILSTYPSLPFLPSCLPVPLRLPNSDVYRSLCLSCHMSPLLSFPIIAGLFCRNETLRDSLCFPFHYRILYPWSQFDLTLIDWFQGQLSNSELMTCTSHDLWSSDKLLEVLNLEANSSSRSYFSECSHLSLGFHYLFLIGKNFSLNISVELVTQTTDDLTLFFECCNQSILIDRLIDTFSFSQLIILFLTGYWKENCCNCLEVVSNFVILYANLKLKIKRTRNNLRKLHTKFSMFPDLKPSIPSSISSADPFLSIPSTLSKQSLYSHYKELPNPNPHCSSDSLYKRLCRKFNKNHVDQVLDLTDTSQSVKVNESLECDVHFARQFEVFRKLKFGHNYSKSFISSLFDVESIGNEGGKSSAVFRISNCKRFIIKSVKYVELENFMLNFNAYFNHFCCSLLPNGSFIVPIVGLFTVILSNTDSSTQKFGFIISENVHFNSPINYQVFDLKGSAWRRKAKPGSNVFLDEDYIVKFYKNPSLISLQEKNHIMTTLARDTLMLSNLNVVDYSLIVGITRTKIRIGIIDYLARYSTFKAVESKVKQSYFYNWKGLDPTIVSPQHYRLRFINSIDCYFLGVADETVSIPSID
ncbi:hypothetical protein P9112_000174 [Eukaryota sp. TZLM1-RC]